MCIKKKDFQELEARIELLESQWDDLKQALTDFKQDVKLYESSQDDVFAHLTRRLNKLNYLNQTSITSQLTLIAQPNLQCYKVNYKGNYLGIITTHLNGKSHQFVATNTMPNSNEDFDNSWAKYQSILGFLKNDADFIMDDDKIIKQYPDKKGTLHAENN